MVGQFCRCFGVVRGAGCGRIIVERATERDVASNEHRLAAGRAELVVRIARTIGGTGTVEPLEGLRLRRASVPTELGHGTSFPSFCVIAQGAKEIRLGERAFRYDPDHYLIAS